MAKVVTSSMEFEGETFEEKVIVTGEDVPAWEAERSFAHVGREQTRIDAVERVTGRARYTSDVALPGLLVAGVLRCPHAHARLTSIDTSAAEALPGVRAVLTPYDEEGAIIHRNRPLLKREPMYEGDEIAAVAADSEEALEDALRLITVSYAPLPFVTDIEEALRPGAPSLGEQGNLTTPNGKPKAYRRGDVEQGLREADATVELRFTTPTAMHNCMEPHGSVAFWEGDQLTVHDSTQHIFGVREALAKELGLPMSRVRVIKHYMGGGFGSKGGLGTYTMIAALLSRKTGRPVRLMLNRHEENLAAGNRGCTVQMVRAGARKDGTLTAFSLRSTTDSGMGGMVSPVGGPTKEMYRCDNVEVIEYGAHTNTGPSSPFRAPGYVEGTVALEGALDELAGRLGIDPLEFRVRNYAAHDQVTNVPYSTKTLREAYERGAALIGWQRRSRSAGSGRYRRGLGMASQLWGGSGGPPAYCMVTISGDGYAHVSSGTQDIGTGTRTVMAQVVAEELGFDIEHIVVDIGDTLNEIYAPISAGSMTVPSVMPAARMAAAAAKQHLLDAASALLDTPAETLTIEDWRFVLPTGERKPVGDVLGPVNRFRVQGDGSRFPLPDNVRIRTFGAQFAEVEVDTETGRVRVERLVAVHDVGRVLNPLTLGSQMEGGMIQGLGLAVTEERIIDPTTGRVLNADLENYKVPTVRDIGRLDHEMIDNPDLLVNNIGAKGAGEPPIIPTPAAIANAVANALGVRITSLPLTPARVLDALRAVAHSPQESPQS